MQGHDYPREHYIQLRVKADTLARIINEQHLHVSELHCLTQVDKAHVQALLLQVLSTKNI